MKPKLFVFILGLIVGLLIGLVGPPLLNQVLPEGLSRAKSATTGRVVAKRLQEDRLLLTIESEEGAVLATFKQRVPEIDLLVETGDRVALGITSYEPFVEDPEIVSVKKGAGEAEEAAEAMDEAEPAEQEPMERESRAQPEPETASEPQAAPEQPAGEEQPPPPETEEAGESGDGDQGEPMEEPPPAASEEEPPGE
jgi:hypothetical protein